MPELPEVETVRSGLGPMITRCAINQVQVLHPRAVRNHELGPDDFAATLVGRVFTEPRRRGKFLWLPFNDGDALVAHLGMSGQFRVNRPGDVMLPHTRVVLSLLGPGDVDLELRFVDQRMFGGLRLSRGGAVVPDEVSHIALDPFDPDFDLSGTAARMRKRRTGVKRALLDQGLVSGIGNIYADEALWLARIHPERRTESLSRAEARGVLEAAQQVMRDALEQGGTSFDTLYVHVNGESGYFDRALNAYGQDGLPCPRCGTPIVRQKFTNRSSHLCPSCQKAPRTRRPSAVAGGAQGAAASAGAVSATAATTAAEAVAAEVADADLRPGEPDPAQPPTATKQADTKQADTKQADTKQADTKQAATKRTDTKRAAANQRTKRPAGKQAPARQRTAP